MTNNIAKIRAALVMCDCPVCDEALAARAELEKAAAQPAPKFDAPEVTDEVCESAYFRACAISDEAGGNSIEIGDGDAGEARIWLSAWQLELGPTLGLVELREPTPEECADMAEWFKSECLACCINSQESADYGRAIFDAVKIVMWPKSEGS